MDSHVILVAFHLIGFAFGLGGATASDLVFVRSTQDGQVSKDEFKIIKTLSLLIWTSVALLIASGVLLMLLEYTQTGQVPRLGWSFFQLKILAFSVLVANGLVFHFKVFPYLRSIVGKSFRADAVKARYWLFAVTGATSIVSWYTAFLMVAFSNFWIDYPLLLLLAGYLVFIVLGAVGAFFVLHLHANKSNVLKTIKQLCRSKFVQLAVLAATGLLAIAALYWTYWQLEITVLTGLARSV